jgi:hypothetical protein
VRAALYGCRGRPGRRSAGPVCAREVLPSPAASPAFLEFLGAGRRGGHVLLVEDLAHIGACEQRNYGKRLDAHGDGRQDQPIQAALAGWPAASPAAAKRGRSAACPARTTAWKRRAVTGPRGTRPPGLTASERRAPQAAHVGRRPCPGRSATVRSWSAPSTESLRRPDGWNGRNDLGRRAAHSIQLSSIRSGMVRSSMLPGSHALHR